MLARLTVTKWDGFHDQRVLDTTNGTVFLFNGSNLNGLLVRASTESSFMFAENRHNPREKAQYIEATQTVANIVTYSDYTWNSAFVAVYVYPDNDLTQSTVLTRINCESISFVYKDVQYPTSKSHIVYYEGGKRRDVLCTYDLNQVYALIDTGKLTTS